MARRVMFQNVMKNATANLENHGRDSSEFQEWYSETAQHLDLKQKAILDAFIDAWMVEHPQLWVEDKDGDWTLIVHGLSLASIERQNTWLSASSSLFEVEAFSVEIEDLRGTAPHEEDGVEADVQEKTAKLKTRLEAYIYTQLSEILDTLGKVTMGVS